MYDIIGQEYCKEISIVKQKIDENIQNMTGRGLACFDTGVQQ